MRASDTMAENRVIFFDNLRWLFVQKQYKHLGLWEIKARPPPKANSPPMAQEYNIGYTDSQLPVPARRLSGGSDNYLYVDPEYPETYPA
jgi:hypothetical protein